MYQQPLYPHPHTSLNQTIPVAVYQPQADHHHTQASVALFPDVRANITTSLDDLEAGRPAHHTLLHIDPLQIVFVKKTPGISISE
jgi:hypothetical protein